MDSILKPIRLYFIILKDCELKFVISSRIAFVDIFVSSMVVFYTYVELSTIPIKHYVQYFI